jgi:hypothetical protein
MDMFQTTKSALYNTLRAVSLYQSEDLTRFHLNGVNAEINGDGRLRWIATDGHTLAKSEPCGSCGVARRRESFIDSAQVKRLLAMIKPTNVADRQTPVVLTLSNTDLVCTVGNDQVTFARPDIGAFPPWREVTPESNNSSDKGAGLINIAPRYLERAGKTMTYMHGSKALQDKATHTEGYAISVPENDLAPIRLDHSVADVGDLTVIIMPTRVR